MNLMLLLNPIFLFLPSFLHPLLFAVLLPHLSLLLTLHDYLERKQKAGTSGQADTAGPLQSSNKQ